MEKAIRYYRSLFTFPSYRKVIAYLYLASIVGSILYFLMTQRTVQAIKQGAIFGALFATVTILVDVAFVATLTRKDPIFDLRRCSCLSFVSCAAWMAILVLAVIMAELAGNAKISTKISLLTFPAISALRFLALNACSSTGLSSTITASFIQPIFWLFISRSYYVLVWTPSSFIATITGALITIVSTFLFLKLVDRYGEKKAGVKPLSLFKAFLLDWIANVRSPLEEFLEKMSRPTTTLTTLLAFNCDDRIKSTVIVPNVHFGPFRNVGSSALPLEIQRAVERRTRGIALVFHGTCGHGLNLPSQAEVKKVVDSIGAMIRPKKGLGLATKLVRVKIGHSKATCQLFGNGALLTLTCAPKTMEDLPEELGLKIANAGKRLGLAYVAVIDAHNSIDEERLSKKDIENLRRAAIRSMVVALEEPKRPFKIGIARTIPHDIGLTEGLGPCGIGSLIVEVGNEKFAYVVIDGNNMVAGLRETILYDLKSLGISDGEILTTDTHAVNAVSLAQRGYNPIGETIPYERIRTLILETTQQAFSNLEKAEALWDIRRISKLRVIGSESTEKLAELVDLTATFAKRIAPLVFLPAFLASALLLLA